MAIDLMSEANPDAELELDFNDFDRVDGAAGAVLSTGLLGSLAKAKLIVLVPEDATRLARLARTGLTFALANREPATTRIIGPDLTALNLDAWTHSWSRGSPLAFEPLLEAEASAQQDLALFPASELATAGGDPGFVGSHHAAFINPHLAGPAGNSSSVNGIAKPWLQHLAIGWQPRGTTFVDYAAFTDDVATILKELVENIRQHAVRRGDNGRPAESLVKIAVVEGGDANRVYVSVQDTGPGIPQTARPKVASQLTLDDDLTDAELVRGLLDEAFAAWHRSRGAGLPRVREICTTRGGWLRIATRKVRLTAATETKAATSAFDLLGTVVMAMIPAR